MYSLVEMRSTLSISMGVINSLAEIIRRIKEAFATWSSEDNTNCIQEASMGLFVLLTRENSNKR
jgi:hypothetical protein